MTGRPGLFLTAQKVVWWVAPLLALTLAGCGGSEYRFPGHKPEPMVLSVSVTCSPSSIPSGQTSQCSATVTVQGNAAMSVTWSATAGQISSSGLFTAPLVTSPLSVTITAISQWDPTKSGTATVTVGGTQPPLGNVLPIVVDAGPAPQTFATVNEAFATVTVCIPGTQNCQTIDHVLVDTGSYGLRLLSAAGGGELTLALPNQPADSKGNPLLECTVFLGGYTWGNVAQADVTLASEVASSVPVQVIMPSTSSPAVPPSCSSQTTGPNMGNSVIALGANGILGVGLFQQDCGVACTTQNSTIPNVYYDCMRFGCSPTYVTLAQQVTNPVTLFATDNNGVLVQLPAVPNGGSLDPSGNLIFGIGTQSNNGLGGATVLAVPDSGTNIGMVITTFKGVTYPDSFFDSGSNGLFFLDTATTGIATCKGQLSPWYCPSNSPVNLSATNQGQNANGNPVGTPSTVNFSIESASYLFTTGNTAFSTLGGPGFGGFDWGLTFFYGRNVFTAIDNMSTPAGPGPYYAY